MIFLYRKSFYNLIQQPNQKVCVSEPSTDLPQGSGSDGRNFPSHKKSRQNQDSRSITWLKNTSQARQRLLFKEECAEAALVYMAAISLHCPQSKEVRRGDQQDRNIQPATMTPSQPHALPRWLGDHGTCGLW